MALDRRNFITAAFFGAVADHVAYLDHPLHHAFMEKCSGL